MLALNVDTFKSIYLSIYLSIYKYIIDPVCMLLLFYYGSFIDINRDKTSFKLNLLPKIIPFVLILKLLKAKYYLFMILLTINLH